MISNIRLQIDPDSAVEIIAEYKPRAMRPDVQPGWRVFALLPGHPDPGRNALRWQATGKTLEGALDCLYDRYRDEF